LNTDWSIYEIDSLFDEHPYKQETLFYENHWGKDTTTSLIAGKQYMDLWVAANNCINLSGDLHHCFIEGFNIQNGKLYLSTGS